MGDPATTRFVSSIQSVANGRQRLLSLDDGREFFFSAEAFERVRVSVGDPAPEELFTALEAAESRVNAHEAALRLLASRPRSEQEMRTRLAMRGIEPAAIDDEIERLQRAGLLDDKKFAQAWVEERKQSAPRGRRLLRYELLGRGIEPEAVDSATRDIDDRQIAFDLARRKARSAKLDDYGAFVTKVGGFLRRRGFDYQLSAEATRSAWDEARQEQGMPQNDDEQDVLVADES